MKTDRPYRRYGEYYREPSGLKRLDFMAKHVIDQTQKRGREIRILDAGCGNGNISISIGSLGSNRIIGIDPDIKSIEKARRLNPFENVTFLCRKVEDLHFPERFDVIICSEVLEHLERPEQMLNVLKDVLREDGVFLFTIPNGYGPLEIINHIHFKANNTWLGELIRAMKAKIKANEDSGIQSSNIEDSHVQFFTLLRFTKLLKREGIDIVSVRNSNCYLGFGVLYYLLLQTIINRGSKLFRVLDMLDCAIADMLPRMLAAGWYFVCKPIDPGNRNQLLP